MQAELIIANRIFPFMCMIFFVFNYAVNQKTSQIDLSVMNAVPVCPPTPALAPDGGEGEPKLQPRCVDCYGSENGQQG